MMRTRTINIFLCFFIFLGLIICFLLFIYTGSNSFSHEISDWLYYGQTISAWIGLCLSAINILVLILLNNSIKESDKKLNQHALETEKEKLKAQLRYDNYVKFKQEWYDSYKRWQENAQIDNQPLFDEFKTIFYQYINNDRYLEKNIINLNAVKWWIDKLNSIEKYYITNADYNANDASIQMSPKIQELFVEIANNIFEYTQEKSSNSSL